MKFKFAIAAAMFIGSVVNINAQTAPTTPPATKPNEVNARMENQHDRIQQGVKSGELTKGEAKNLRKDQKAIHVLGISENKIVAYARLFKAGDYFENASIGRVIVHPKARANKWGHNLMTTAIRVISTHFNETKITISAQLYLQKFYESHGFVVVGNSYLEDDIPHIEMKM